MKNNTTKSENSVLNGLKIIKTALKKNVSLAEASRQNGFGRNYVCDLNSRIASNYKKKLVSKENYSTFKTLLKEYKA